MSQHFFLRILIYITCISVCFLIVVYGYLCIRISSMMNKPLLKSSTMVVLGARSYKDGGYNPCLVSRVDKAAQIMTPQIKTIILSGGIDKEDGSIESEVMAQLLKKRMDPSLTAYLVQEHESTSTYENLINSLRLIEDKKSLITIVTEPFHAPRVALIAQKLGMHVQVATANTSPCWSRWTYVSRYSMREIVALISYKLKGYI